MPSQSAHFLFLPLHSWVPPHCRGGDGTLCKCLLFFSLYRLLLRTDQTSFRLAQCCPYLHSLLLDLLSPFLLIRRGGGRWAPHDWIGLWFMFSPCMYICHMWICHIYVPTNLSTLFQISTQIGILSFFFFFFSVTSITGTGILYKRKKNRRLIIVICMTYTNGDIKAMCTPVCVAIIYSSAKQYTQSVFAF